jgi:hypothetical protein
VRVNVYAEEMTDRIEIISKEIDGRMFTGLRFYLELPTTVPRDLRVAVDPYLVPTRDDGIKKVEYGRDVSTVSLQGKFMHRPGDDDSAAVTFWGKRDLRGVLRKALEELDKHYASREI